MDIGSKKGYPSSALSNFAPHEFYFDGVKCSSMEGLLQAFKFDKWHIQVYMCSLVGLKAKYKGKNRNKAWKSKQVLWWNGMQYDRHGEDYQNLLKRAYDALFENSSFRKALKATKGMNLTHSLGCNDASHTVLTETEFIRNLNRLKTKIED